MVCLPHLLKSPIPSPAHARAALPRARGSPWRSPEPKQTLPTGSSKVWWEVASNIYRNIYIYTYLSIIYIVYRYIYLNICIIWYWIHMYTCMYIHMSFIRVYNLQILCNRSSPNLNGYLFFSRQFLFKNCKSKLVIFEGPDLLSASREDFEDDVAFSSAHLEPRIPTTWRMGSQDLIQ